MNIKSLAIATSLIAAAPVAAQVTQADSAVNNYAAAPTGLFSSIAYSQDFEGGTSLARFGADGSGTPVVATTTVGGQYTRPTNDTSGHFAAVGPAIGGASNTPSIFSTAGLTFNRVSLYWGSQDAYNVLSFLVGNTVVASFTGGAGQAGAESSYEIYTIAPSLVGQITGLSFSSNRDNAFEFDDLILGSAVPEPASWALMIVGLGMIGGVLRRRKQVGVGSLATA